MCGVGSLVMASFQHEALLYDGDAGFADGAVPFLREGIEGGEPMLVAVSAQRIGLLRSELGDAADAVEFVDMEQLGRNPGRIIPAWRDFVATRRGANGASGAIRGIGEPIWAGRSAEELAESQLHEALLNLAFADTDDFRLLCPYDRSALGDAVVREACCSHPSVVDRGRRHRSDAYRGAEQLLDPFKAPLPPPRAQSEVLAYDRTSLREVRARVAARCAAAGIEDARAGDFVLAVDEAAANSVRHGGGNGVLRTWVEGAALICEARDRGYLADPLAGRRVPEPGAPSGWGLYIAHQVCDLVQLRSDDHGTVVRMHMRIAENGQA
jgi:anti-sigma regulatory factor (Ser/Thr protein kinase)